MSRVDGPTAKASFPVADPKRSALILQLTTAMNFGRPLHNHHVTDEAHIALIDHVQSGADMRGVDAAMAPLAKFLAACSRAEESLAVLLATVLNPADPARITPVLDRMPTSVKIQQLRSALPSHHYYRTMLKKAEDLFSIRNKAAHGQVRTWKIEEPNIRFGLWIVSQGSWVDIQDARLRDLRREAQTLSASANAATTVEGTAFVVPDGTTFGELVLTVAELLPEHIQPEDTWATELAIGWYPQGASVIVPRNDERPRTRPEG